jgi:hypothetical protein
MNNTKNKLHVLKIKLANLQIEIQALIDKGEREPGMIDAIVADISGFTDEVTKIRKQLDVFKDKTSKTESIFEIYNKIKDK